MNDQSHKDEMAAALRADFARLRARGVDAVFAGPTSAVPDEADTAAVPPSEPASPANARPGWFRLLRRG